MNIEKKREGTSLTLSLEGRLDTNTAPLLETVVKEDLDGVTDVVMDFENLSYLSSAGLRVLLMAQKKMNSQGTMVIRHVNKTVHDIFELTGFLNILSIK